MPAPDRCTSSRALPRDQEKFMEGFSTGNMPAEKRCPGVLGPPPGQNPRPFELVLKTFATGSMSQQVEAISCALCSILADYRGCVAQRNNL
jgi:hypothetical protein